MSKLWILLGYLSLMAGLYGIADQSSQGIEWAWSQLWHHEPLVGIAFSVGIALLIVGITNKRREK